MRILVTGAGGFIGSCVVDRLLAAGHDVTAVGSELARGDCRVISARFDVCDWSGIGEIDRLVHLAALNDTTVRDEQRFRRVNVDAAIRFFNDAIGAGCSGIVYASSMHVYGPVPTPMSVTESVPSPVSPYGRSKLMLERAAAALEEGRGVQCVGLRLGNVYGPGEARKGIMASQVFQIARQMRRGDPEVFAFGTQYRDFIYVEDAADAFVAAAESTNPNVPRILNCGSGFGTSFNELIDDLNVALGLSRSPKYVTEPAGYLSAVLLDSATTVAALDWHPRPLREGIATYLASGELG